MIFYETDYWLILTLPRSVETGHLDGVFMHKKAQKLKFLCERNDKVIIWLELDLIQLCLFLTPAFLTPTLLCLFSPFPAPISPTSTVTTPPLARYFSPAPKEVPPARSTSWLWTSQAWPTGSEVCARTVQYLDRGAGISQEWDTVLLPQHMT